LDGLANLGLIELSFVFFDYLSITVSSTVYLLNDKDLVFKRKLIFFSTFLVELVLFNFDTTHLLRSF
jgi:hypothetical protein